MDILFYIFLPLVAFAYAAVGHGGASGYLALMGLFAFEDEILRPTALLLNLFVAGISFFHFYKAGFFKPRPFLVFACTSIPLAFLGGTLKLDTQLYKIILGVFLFLAVIKMSGLMRTINKTDYDGKSNDVPLVGGFISGGAIGIVSGLIGIGGGIVLSPVILLMRWANAKEAAAISALFIWVNSFAGLVGHYASDQLSVHHDWWIFVLLVLGGGFIGGLVGAKTFTTKGLRFFLSVVLLIAAVKLIFGL